jgi:hypothetical protein
MCVHHIKLGHNIGNGRGEEKIRNSSNTMASANWNEIEK